MTEEKDLHFEWTEGMTGQKGWRDRRKEKGWNEVWIYRSRG